MTGAPSPAPGGPREGSGPRPYPSVFPEVWARQDLPGLPWCFAKGIAKAIVLVFFAVLVPLELFYSLFGASNFPISHPFTVELITYGGGALALTSGAFTATQTTRLYGFFRLANRGVKLAYQYIIATLALITFGPVAFGGGGGGSTSGQIAVYFGFAVVMYLFMIVTTIAALAAFVTLYEDHKHPGERLPWDYPLSRRVRRRREKEMAAALGVVPPS